MLTNLHLVPRSTPVPTGPLEDPLELGPSQDAQEAASGTGDRL